MPIKTNKKQFSEKQRLHQISQLIKKDLTNLKKSKKEEPNTVEVVCTPHDIFHSKNKKR